MTRSIEQLSIEFARRSKLCVDYYFIQTMDLVRSIAVKVAHTNLFIGDGILIVCGPITSILVAWISYESIERQLTKIILKKIQPEHPIGADK
jgi:hypothetical protein